jgi:hypothetical protein
LEVLVSSEMKNVIKVDAHEAEDFVQFIGGSFDNPLNGLTLLKQISHDAPEIDLCCRPWPPSTSLAAAWV